MDATGDRTKTAPAGAAVKPSAPTSRRPATGPRLQKRKLTLAEAADQYEKTKREMERLKPLLEEAGAVLLEHFERTGRAGYRGRIGWKWSGGQLYLDQEALRAYLGAKVADFQKRAKRSRSLMLLK